MFNSMHPFGASQIIANAKEHFNHTEKRPKKIIMLKRDVNRKINY